MAPEDDAKDAAGRAKPLRPYTLANLDLPAFKFPILDLASQIDLKALNKFSEVGRLAAQQQAQMVSLMPKFPVIDPDVFSGMTAVVRQLAEQQKTWAPLLESFRAWQQSFAATWAPLIEEARRWGQAYAEARELLIPHGWLISPSLAAGLAPSLLRAIREHGESVIDQFMMAYCTPQALRDIVEGCCNRPSYAKFRKTFNKALDAHERGDPELAIPIWLIAIDGICAAELDVADIFSRLNSEADRRRVQAVFGTEDPRSTIEQGASDAVIRIMAELGRPKTGRGRKRRPRGLLPRRHDILHGSVPDIGDAAYSARCILVLEHLHWCLENVDERETRRAKPKEP